MRKLRPEKWSGHSRPHSSSVVWGLECEPLGPWGPTQSLNHRACCLSDLRTSLLWAGVYGSGFKTVLLVQLFQSPVTSLCHKDNTWCMPCHGWLSLGRWISAMSGSLDWMLTTYTDDLQEIHGSVLKLGFCSARTIPQTMVDSPALRHFSEQCSKLI